MWSRVQIAALTALLAASCLPDRTKADPGTPPSQSTVLFQDVRIFDGKSDSLSAPSNVLVRGNKIDKISTDPISIDDIAGVTIINCGGRTLMPGLIDAHWHAMLVRPNPVEALGSDIGYLNLLAGAEATATLMRGFTTIRDMGGPVFGLKRAIDEGLLPGPRIYPSGAVITITGGHGDFRSLSELPRRPGTLSRVEETGAAMIADSPDEVRTRTREQLLQGASQIKLTAGGGVASPFSPLDVVDLYRARASRRRRSRRELGYLCRHPRLHAGFHPAFDCRGSEMHRARTSDGRRNGKADGGERHMAKHAAVPRRGRGRRRSATRTCGTGENGASRSKAPTTSTDSRRSTISRPRSAPTSCFPRTKRSSRVAAWPRSFAGTRPLKR